MDLILREYKKVVKRNIEAAKGQIRRRQFIIAIDETHEPFYGRIKMSTDHKITQILTRKRIILA